MTTKTNLKDWIISGIMKFFGLNRFYFEEVILTEDFIRQATAYATESHPYECYGIIRGKIKNKRLFLTMISFVMHQSEKHKVTIKPTLFNNTRGFGTFHSHPSGNTKYSKEDLNSFAENPINIIIGYPYSTSNISLYDHEGNSLNFSILKNNISSEANDE